MSLVTQCPACGTAFKVVRDQLRISDGWVRCGQCAEVFDSGPNLRELVLAELPQAAAAAAWPDPLPAAAPEVAPETAAPLQVDGMAAPLVPDGPAAADVVQVADGPPEAAGGGEPLGHLDPLIDPLNSLEPASPEPAAGEPASAAVAMMDSVLDDPAAPDLAEPVQEPVPTAAEAMAAFYDPSAEPPASAPPASVAAEAPAEAAVPGAAEPAEAQNFSFIQPPRPPSAWHRPWARAVLGVAGFLLALLLVLQVVVQERDQIAASDPDARRLLLNLCGVLQCQIQPWRQIEAMAVDASGFSKLRGDAYRLSFVVKNTAPVDLARPAIELTLTDTQDQPLLRRVLLPQDLGGQPATLAGGAEWTGSYLVNLAPVAGSSSPAKGVAGYRLLAFYP